MDQKFIFLKPESINRWSYQIDDQKKRSLRSEDVYEFCANYVKNIPDRFSISDIVSRRQPFLILLNTGTVKELHSTDDTTKQHRSCFSQDFLNITNGKSGSGNVLISTKDIETSPLSFPSKAKTDILSSSFVKSSARSLK